MIEGAADKRFAVEAELVWQTFYYLYPDYRSEQRADYQKRLMQATQAENKLPDNVKVMSISKFQKLIEGLVKKAK